MQICARVVLGKRHAYTCCNDNAKTLRIIINTFSFAGNPLQVQLVGVGAVAGVAKTHS